jgi:hypothetical protein
MERCPTCDFPMLDEWSECRRCGARLSHEPHAPSLPQRTGVSTGVRTPARPAAIGSTPVHAHPVVLTAPMRDTMIPRRASEPDAAKGEPARRSGDTLIPRSVRRPATIAALVGAGVAAVRLAGRRHRRH